MTAPVYLTIKDVMAILKCGQTYAYELVDRIGRANAPGIARVLESKFYEHLEKDPFCASTLERKKTGPVSGGLRGPKTSAPSGEAPKPRRRAQPSSSSPDGSENERIPFTPLRKLRRSASKPADS